MIHITRSPSEAEASQLPSYQPRGQKKTKFKGCYEGQVISDEACERKEAIGHFTDDGNFKTEKGRKKLAVDFKFKVYKSSDVVEALKRLFNDKCAYCEWEVGVGADVEIEHFRPKKGFIDETTGRLEVPAYYWLGADWGNLFLSCQHCNQARSHDIPGEGKSTVGKQSQFPLHEENRRIRNHEQVVAEEEPYRMLLNPCVDRPELYLEFVTVKQDEEDHEDDVKEVGWVIERKPPAPTDPKASDQPRPDGYRSIQVFALQRPMLVGERAKHTGTIHLRLAELIDAGVELRNARKDGSAGWQQSADKNLKAAGGRLKENLVSEANLLGLTRQMLRDYDASGQFEGLRALGLDPMDMLRESIACTEGQ